MELDVKSFLLLFILAGIAVLFSVIMLRVVVKSMSPFRFISKIHVVVPKGYIYQNEAKKFFRVPCLCSQTDTVCDCYEGIGDHNERSAIISGKRYSIQLYTVKKRFCISCDDVRKFTLRMGGVLTGLSGLLLVNLLQDKAIIPSDGVIVAISDYNSYLINSYEIREIPTLENHFEYIKFGRYVDGHKFGEKDYFLVFIPM